MGLLLCAFHGSYRMGDLINTLRPGQNGRHFADDIFKCIILKDNVWISIKISLKFVPKGPINNIPALLQIMAWCRPGDKPLSEPMMVRLPMLICITRPQWVNRTPSGNIPWDPKVVVETDWCYLGNNYTYCPWLRWWNVSTMWSLYNTAGLDSPTGLITLSNVELAEDNKNE